MEDAISRFVGTPEEARYTLRFHAPSALPCCGSCVYFRVTIANAEMALAQGNIKEALEMLARISEDKPYEKGYVCVLPRTSLHSA